MHILRLSFSRGMGLKCYAEGKGERERGGKKPEKNMTSLHHLEVTQGHQGQTYAWLLVSDFMPVFLVGNFWLTSKKYILPRRRARSLKQSGSVFLKHHSHEIVQGCICANCFKSGQFAWLEG